MAIVEAGPDKLKFVAGERLARLFETADGALEWSLIAWSEEQFLKRDKVFLDVGAHVGTWALSYAKKCAHVVAIEANYQNYCRLVAGVALNELYDEVSCFHAAAGNQNGGHVMLNVGVGDWSGFGCSVENYPVNGETRPERVPALRIDTLGLGNVGLVKIDVEGHEREVLRGLRRTLMKSGNPPILLECWSAEVFPWYAEERQGVLLQLESMGYSAAPIIGWPHMLLVAHP